MGEKDQGGSAGVCRVNTSFRSDILPEELAKKMRRSQTKGMENSTQATIYNTYGLLHQAHSNVVVRRCEEEAWGGWMHKKKSAPYLGNFNSARNGAILNGWWRGKDDKHSQGRPREGEFKAIIINASESTCARSRVTPGEKTPRGRLTKGKKWGREGGASGEAAANPFIGAPLSIISCGKSGKDEEIERLSRLCLKCTTHGDCTDKQSTGEKTTKEKGNRFKKSRLTGLLRLTLVERPEEGKGKRRGKEGGRVR